MTFAAVAATTAGQILIGATVLSTASSIYSGEKSRNAQKKANKKQERQARLASSRDAMAQVRQARIAQAQIMQGASTQGTLNSSGAQGGYGAVGSLTSGNMQFLNQVDSMNSQIGNLMQRSQRYAGQASNYNALANLSMQGMSFMNPTPVNPAGGGGTPATLPPTNTNVNYGGGK
tara:strand:+ start:23 stop:547 length:525 start_codon:yes stop_codon:yes gene_type:complete